MSRPSRSEEVTIYQRPVELLQKLIEPHKTPDSSLEMERLSRREGM